MADGTAAALLREVGFNGHADIHITAEPIAPGMLYDPNGDALIPTGKRGVMEKFDARATESVTLSRGTIWLICTLVGVVPIGLAILVYIVGWSMSAQAERSRLDNLEVRMEKIEKSQEDIQALKLTTNNVQSDVTAIRKKQEADEQDKKDMGKNINDIRILLAGQKLNQ